MTPYQELLKENKELKETLKKMRNCYNCNYGYTSTPICDKCVRFSKWELEK